MAAAAAAAAPPSPCHLYLCRPHAHQHLLHIYSLSSLLSAPVPRLRSTSKPLSAVSTQLPFQGLAETLLHSEERSEDEDAGKERTEPQVPLPKLSVKEKKELASYAHSLGKKLKSQQVGKSGITPSVAASFVENLESNELLKIKVHENCPAEFEDAVTQLEEATGSVAISQIGRSVILYRPSTTKMKKKEEQAARTRKVWKPKPRSPPPSSRMQRNQTTASSRSFRRRSS